MKTVIAFLLGLLLVAGAAVAGQSSTTVAVSCRVIPSIPQSVAYAPASETKYVAPSAPGVTYTSLQAAERAALPNKGPNKRNDSVVYVRMQVNY